MSDNEQHVSVNNQKLISTSVGAQLPFRVIRLLTLDELRGQLGWFFAKEDCQRGMFFVFGEIFIGMSRLLVMNFFLFFFRKERNNMYILFAEKESSKERILIGELHRLSVRGSRNRAGNCGTLEFMMRRPPPEEARMPVTKYLKKKKKKFIRDSSPFSETNYPLPPLFNYSNRPVSNVVRAYGWYW